MGQSYLYPNLAKSWKWGPKCQRLWKSVVPSAGRIFCTSSGFQTVEAEKFVAFGKTSIHSFQLFLWKAVSAPDVGRFEVLTLVFRCIAVHVAYGFPPLSVCIALLSKLRNRTLFLILTIALIFQESGILSIKFLSHFRNWPILLSFYDVFYKILIPFITNFLIIFYGAFLAFNSFESWNSTSLQIFLVYSVFLQIFLKNLNIIFKLFSLLFLCNLFLFILPCLLSHFKVFLI